MRGEGSPLFRPKRGSCARSPCPCRAGATKHHSATKDVAHNHRSLCLVLGDLREDQPKPIPILTLCQLGQFLKNRSEHEAVVQDSDQVFVTSANRMAKAL